MAGVAGPLEAHRVWFNEKGDRTGVPEGTFEESFGPYTQIGGRSSCSIN